MVTKQLYTQCLAQGAYFIANNGEAAIIDPLREVDTYLALAQEHGAKIKYIFETHFHADFVSGHVELAEATGATIVFGPNAQTAFTAHIAHDGEIFTIGDLQLEVLHTPGHTLESSCFLLKNEQGIPQHIYTGDTLFLGDVGRPDLAQKSTITQEDLAGMLFDSLRNKIMPLPDNLIVFPGHGAGSACGKNMSTDTQDSLGNQKKNNYALRSNMTKAEFVQELTEGLLPPPGYFSANVKLNKAGAQAVAKLEETIAAVSAENAQEYAQKHNAVILDVRDVEEFKSGHIPNSTFIGLDGNFAPWVGTVIQDTHTPILLVCPTSRRSEAITRLARVGFDQVMGHVDSNQLKDIHLSTVTSVEPESFSGKGEQILDVRKPGEFAGGHVIGAVNTPLDFLRPKDVDASKETYLYCAGGYRSVIVWSLLTQSGHQKLININGGFNQIIEENPAILAGEKCSGSCA